MKCVVIYFSQTGNTEKIARAVQAGVKQISVNCDLFTIKDANPKRLFEYDLIGLGSPVFAQKEPANITAFINDLRFVGGKHIFSFCTHNTVGYSYNPSVVPQLRKKGLIVIGWNDWYGSSWGPINQATPYPTDGHPDAIDLKEAEEWGREMVWRSQKIYGGEINLIPEGPEPLQPINTGDKSPIRHLQFRYERKFARDRCLYPQCRLCMDNCPMDGIDLSVDPPVLADPCLGCTFCEQLCPTGAIYVDEANQEILFKFHTNAIRTVCLKCLDEAEAQGRFRRLIPEEELTWDTPIYKAYSKHPRFIIGYGRP
ncbi:MAG: EFR1 family ferrodoxin [Dehalococcoidales bacterium]|nr:EFR1 family ferrodoxin [Dehalococcoidales bacterium]